MNQQLKYRRIIAIFLAVLLTAVLIIPTTLSVSAANRLFITELRVEAGEEAVTSLEAEGWSVFMSGLNITSDPASQVYLAYKLNTGSPYTNVIVSPDVGDSFTDENGIVYQCVSHVDVDEGNGGGGCLYATRDQRAGSPLVGLDVLRGNNESNKVLYPITNDGAEIVRTQEGAPADLEKGNGTDVVYLAQIRDGIVRPYIREIGVITDTDKWNAVYTAAERGYNYYVDGDIDDSSETYTIIGYERTADPAEAITNITAVSAKTVQSLEDEQIIDNRTGQAGHLAATAISISGAEYVRISSQPVDGKEPYYIYRTKDTKAGNPISMLYAEKTEQKQNYLFGTWANGYFFSPGVTTAYTYSMNEDLYTTLWGDQTVLTKLPVQLKDSVTSSDTLVDPTEVLTKEKQESTTDNSSEVKPVSTTATSARTQQESTTEIPSETEQESITASSSETEQESITASSSEAEQEISIEIPAEEQSEIASEEPSKEQSETSAADGTDETIRYINLTMLTPRDGLPETTASITGMLGDPSVPYVERTQRSNRVNKFQASVFGTGGVTALIAGSVVMVMAVVAAVLIHKKRAAVTLSEKPGESGKSKATDHKKKSKNLKNSKNSKKYR